MTLRPYPFACTVQGSTDVIEVLLKYRADLLVEDKNGATPLKLASDKRHREAATLLERLIQERGEHISHLLEQLHHRESLSALIIVH